MSEQFRMNPQNNAVNNHEDPVCEERSQTICICPDCIMKYLSDFENNKNSIWPSSNQEDDENKEPANIDRNLHANLHILWIGQFIQLFAPLTAKSGILWYLRPLDVDEKIFYPAIWRSTVKAKVRFECESCQHVWTSMMGTAVFSIHPSDAAVNALELCFTLLGQQCSNCDSKVFQSAIWYPEEVIRVLNYVYWQICDELLFIGNRPQIPAVNSLAVRQRNETLSKPRRAFQAVRTVCRSVSLVGGRQNPIIQSLLTSRAGQPLRQHCSDQCEACMRGVCSALEAPNTTESNRGSRLRLRHHIQHHRQKSTNDNSKVDKATSITPERKVDTASSADTKEIEKCMLKLCLKVPTKYTTFGSIGPANKRGDVVFRSLRGGEPSEDKTKAQEQKTWKSCDDLVAAGEEQSRA
ncbi:hypothetical protein Aperf_G00000015513 [Anoplocephala perfoliata]